MANRLRTSIFLALFCVVASLGLAAETPSASEVRFFESKVRPLLIEHCQGCHGPEKQKGGLRLDNLASMLVGGDSGEAIVPGEADESLLIEAVRYESYEMPPSGKLPDADIDVLVEWIAMGAPWPNADPNDLPPPPKEKGFTEEDRSFWTFQPVQNWAVPEVDDPRWSTNPIDQFIYDRLQREGLEPAPEASRVELIRRASFDLLGLPPTPEEIDAFENDPAPTAEAFERLVDQLLSRPQYGERWGRHWLDLVRYAESDGFRQDATRPHIWRYRDYVIRAFNNDKPYPQFVLEQLAGDEVAPDDPDALAATGYLRHYLYEHNQRDARTQWDDILNNITDTTGDVFLGLGMGCARCHDHKFDAILQDDYFRLQAFFAPLLPRDDTVAATPEERRRYQQALSKWEEATAEISAEIEEALRPGMEREAASKIGMFPPDIQAIMAKPVEQRSQLEHQLAYLVDRQVQDSYDAYRDRVRKSKDEKWKRVQELYKQLAEFDHLKPKSLPPVMSVCDVTTVTPETLLVEVTGETSIAPGFLSVIAPGPAEINRDQAAENSTGRRSTLAEWIGSPDNQLTTRVITNRIWQHHFSQGLVPSSSDFGHLGEPPSHPELLDWLAVRFVEDGWSFKAMHRLIMNSATYRLSATHPNADTCEKIDPENTLHWRRDIRRLEAEQIRDAALAVSGELKLDAGGPSVSASTPRRSVYTRMKRNSADPVLAAFDLPDGIKSTPQRNITTTPTQALLMINGDWLFARAKALAKRVSDQGNDEAAVTLAYRSALGQTPEAEEVADLVAFLDEQAPKTGKQDDDARFTALVDLCHGLLNSSGFLYVD